MLLAQEINTSQIAAGVKEGIESTAGSRPTEWLMALLCLALVFLFLRFLRNMDSKADERESERQRHQETLITKINETLAKSQNECHVHSLAMMTRQNEATGDLKAIVGDLREIAKDNRSMVERVIERLDAT